MVTPIATAPGAWGVEPGGSPLDPPWPHVLDDVAAAGFDGSELGPLSYLPEAPRRLATALRIRELRLAGGFVMEPFHVPEERQRIERLACRTCTTLAGAGAETIVLIEALVPERSRTAGRTDAAPRLDAAGWEALIDGVDAVARIAADEFGLKPVFHPHAGTYVEFADEVERLLADTDQSLLGLCLDTGHAVYAGIDPADLARRHHDRLRHVHVKDLRAAVLADARARGCSFEEAVAAGIFCPLGDGDVDLLAVRVALEAIGYDGWIVYEQDRVAGDPHAKEEAERSLRHLREIGIAPDLRPSPSAR